MHQVPCKSLISLHRGTLMHVLHQSASKWFLFCIKADCSALKLLNKRRLHQSEICLHQSTASKYLPYGEGALGRATRSPSLGSWGRAAYAVCRERESPPKPGEAMAGGDRPKQRHTYIGGRSGGLRFASPGEGELATQPTEDTGGRHQQDAQQAEDDYPGDHDVVGSDSIRSRRERFLRRGRGGGRV